MFQGDNTGWDPIYLWTPVPIVTQIYALFLFVVLIVALVKLVRVWSGVPPFRLKLQAGNPDYLRVLERSRRSTKQWIGLVSLSWAFVFSHEFANFTSYVDESKTTGLTLLVSSIRSLGVLTEMAAFVVLFLFLVQWHMLNRVEQLRAWEAEKQR